MLIGGKRLSHLFISLLLGLFLVGVAFFSLANQTRSAFAGSCEVPSEHPTIQEAIRDPACDTIWIAAGTYTETLVITRSVSLKGQGSNSTILDGQGITRLVSIDGSSSMNSVVVFLNDLRVTNGNATQANADKIGGGVYVTGGGVLNGENLQMDNNLASSSFNGYGGGLAVDGGSAFLTNTVFISNTANKRQGQSEGNGYGGGLYVKNGVLHLSDSQIMNNLASFRAGSNLDASGGGLYISEDTQVLLRDNIWTGNIARGAQSIPCELFSCSGERKDEGGGAVGVFLETGTAVITITNDVFVGNIANDVVTTDPNSGRGGAISFNTLEAGHITASLTGVTVDQNIAVKVSAGSIEEGRGGAIYARQTDLSVKSALLFDNLAAMDGNGSGGGIYFHFPMEGGSFELQNSILAGNIACTASDCGDGAQVFIDYSNSISNTARIVHTTIADRGLNSRQGIYYFTPFPGDKLYITNTVITSHTVGVEIDQGEAIAHYNLFHGNTFTHTGTAFLESIGNVPGQPDPLFVDPLDHDYHIQSGSPAIDNGTNAGIKFDFDGDTRPQGNGFDIGADEFPLSPPTKTPTVTPSKTPSPTPKSSSTPTPTNTPTVSSTSVPPAKKVFLPLVIR